MSPSLSIFLPSLSASTLLTTILILTLTTLTLANFTVTRLYHILTRPTPRPRRHRSTPEAPISPNTTTQTTHIPTLTSHLPPRGHLLILLGSGGHTAEMLATLQNLGGPYLDARFARRTWVVSSGDGFSAARAGEFESVLQRQRERERERQRRGEHGQEVDGKRNDNDDDVTWTITTVRRARNVHQSLLSTPVTALACLWDCIGVLRGSSQPGTTHDTENRKNGRGKRDHGHSRSCPYPDLILTNGPGTGVILVFASLILLFIGVAPVSVPVPVAVLGRGKMPTSTSTSTFTHSTPNDPINAPSNPSTPAPTSTPRTRTPEPLTRGAMRSIYIESWARVKKLSLSGRILRFLGGRVLVQWRGLASTGSGSVNGVGGVSSKGEEKEGDGIRDRDRGGNRKEEGIAVWPRETEYIGAIVT